MSPSSDAFYSITGNTITVGLWLAKHTISTGASQKGTNIDATTIRNYC